MNLGRMLKPGEKPPRSPTGYIEKSVEWKEAKARVVARICKTFEREFKRGLAACVA